MSYLKPFFKWADPGLCFFILVFSINMTVNAHFNFLPMTGFEQRTSEVGSDRSTNRATTTAQLGRYLQFTERFCCKKQFLKRGWFYPIAKCIELSISCEANRQSLKWFHTKDFLRIGGCGSAKMCFRGQVNVDLTTRRSRSNYQVERQKRHNCWHCILTYLPTEKDNTPLLNKHFFKSVTSQLHTSWYFQVGTFVLGPDIQCV